MSRINTNVTALISARVLGQNNKNLSKTLEALSTGYKINRGSDDPAGLIASEKLRGEISAIKSSISNAERASGMVSTAEAALAEISDKLVEMQELVAGAASSGGLTQAEIDANQTQVDGIISSINRIANETSFMGSKLLDGSKGFRTTTGAGKAQDVTVDMAKGVESAAKSLTATIVTAGVKAQNGSTVAIDAGGAGKSVTYEITGKLGSTTLTFGHGTAQADVNAAINALTSITGVMVSTGNELVSTDFTADDFVRVEVISGTNGAGLTAGLSATTKGADAVVTVGGVLASVDGYNVSVRTETMDLSYTMTETHASTAADTETITIEAGGGATFLMSPNVGLGGQETIGINAVHAHRLGDATFGHLSDLAKGKSSDLSTDAANAQKIVAAAITQVAKQRGKLGSFISNTADVAVNSLNIALENVSAAESAIRDTDFAQATAELTRNQVLVQASNSVLGIASSTPQNVLGLL